MPKGYDLPPSFCGSFSTTILYNTKKSKRQYATHMSVFFCPKFSHSKCPIFQSKILLVLDLGLWWQLKKKHPSGRPKTQELSHSRLVFLSSDLFFKWVLRDRIACFSNTMGMEVYLVGCEHLKHTFSINISASSAQMKSLRGYESGLSNDTDSLPCLSFAQKSTLYHTRLFALFNFSLKSS
jgi:hypothetical protein